MSLDAANAFRDRLSADPSLHKPFEDAYGRGLDALSELARSHGFDVSPDEAAAAVAAVRNGAELTDYELELVAGGGDTGASPPGSGTPPPRPNYDPDPSNSGKSS